VSGTQKLVSIVAGESHTCGLTGSGDAYCWGRGRDGQLGDGSRTDRSTPVRVSGIGPLRSISAGSAHTCGVTREQAVVCWGGNASGQLGDGTVTPRPTPAPVVTRQ
jgi:alpha-tubulin suppressor-like RCC1 family protein